jgi:hypothetical protein
MRQELIITKNKIQQDLESQLKSIEQYGDQIIVDSKYRILGLCECKGEGSYAQYKDRLCRCEGKGQMEIDREYDPCGRNNYTYTWCSNLKKIPENKEEE